MSNNNNNITPEQLIAKGKLMPSGCIEWQFAKSAYGYGMISYHNKVMSANRLMLILLHGLPETKSVAMHICDNPPCINPEHLRWGSHKENSKDMMAKGRQTMPRLYGEAHANSKLTKEAVEFIRKVYGPDYSQKYLAKLFGVGKTTIGNVLSNKIWR